MAKITKLDQIKEHFQCLVHMACPDEENLFNALPPQAKKMCLAHVISIFGDDLFPRYLLAGDTESLVRLARNKSVAFASLAPPDLFDKLEMTVLLLDSEEVVMKAAQLSHLCGADFSFINKS